MKKINIVTLGTHSVREFQKAFKLLYNTEPTLLTDEQIDLRYKLFLEEFNEFVEGHEAYSLGLEYFTSKNEVKEHSFTYMVDAVCDMYYILFGTLVSHGWKMDYIDHNRLLNNYDKSTSNSLLLLDLAEITLKYKQNLSFRQTPTCGYSFVKKQISLVKKLSFNLGINTIIDELFLEVHKSNLSKLDINGNPLINGENGVLDKSKPLGKVLKSEFFKEPNLYEILKTHKVF